MKNEIKLCGGGRGCPTVRRVGDEIHIADDFGGRVRLTLEEFAKLKKADFTDLKSAERSL